MGLGAMERIRVDEMARHGYVAFAVDMYGAGKRATNSQQAVKLAMGTVEPFNVLNAARIQYTPLAVLLSPYKIY